MPSSDVEVVDGVVRPHDIVVGAPEVPVVDASSLADSGVQGVYHIKLP